MAGSSKRGNGRKKLGNGHGSGGSSNVDTGLSVLPANQSGSGGDTSIWDERVKQALNTPLRDATGNSAASGKGTDSKQDLLSDIGGLCAGSEREGKDSIGSEKVSLSGFEIVKFAEQSHVSDGYRESPQEAATGTSEVRLRPESGILTNSEKFDNLVPLACDVLQEIMLTETPDSWNENYPKILAVKKDAAVSVINSGLKADENRFRKSKTDILQKLYNKVKGNVLVDITPSKD